MNKPEFLYHGSRYKVDVLEPQQAYGSPDENGAEFGIYAYEKEEMAIPFSLTITPFDNGSMGIYIDDDTSFVTISAGIWDETAIGYIYKVSSRTFDLIDDKQWLSKEAVTPLEYKVLNGQDYTSKVKLVGSALEYKLSSK